MISPNVSGRTRVEQPENITVAAANPRGLAIRPDDGPDVYLPLPHEATRGRAEGETPGLRFQYTRVAWE